MSDEHLDEADEPMPLRTKIISSLVLVGVLLGVVFFLMRLGSPAIAASRPAPAAHYPLPCPICHVVTADAAKSGTP
jgi:hypothetical protein